MCKVKKLILTGKLRNSSILRNTLPVCCKLWSSLAYQGRPSFLMLITGTAILLQSWDVFFRSADRGLPPGEAYQAPPTLGGGGATVASVPHPGVRAPATATSVLTDTRVIDDHLAVQAIIRSYQVSAERSNNHVARLEVLAL